MLIIATLLLTHDWKRWYGKVYILPTRSPILPEFNPVSDAFSEQECCYPSSSPLPAGLEACLTQGHPHHFTNS